MDIIQINRDNVKEEHIYCALSKDKSTNCPTFVKKSALICTMLARPWGEDVRISPKFLRMRSG